MQPFIVLFIALSSHGLSYKHRDSLLQILQEENQDASLANLASQDQLFRIEI
jgi:hypothetical protein